ncbi:16868_t:CDS:2 [Gigaspora margarita]|uniref:16868_t:CDS:1 n=1 Tax=Gigaspora margarita TaxID=4874 RepID=A0ABN7W118_GIGMA|nr:16868_t:CDS:2 [Gigaspora margarita]
MDLIIATIGEIDQTKEIRIKKAPDSTKHMYRNTDDIDSVRGTILKTKNDGMNNVGCFYQCGTKVSIWSLR